MKLAVRAACGVRLAVRAACAAMLAVREARAVPAAEAGHSVALWDDEAADGFNRCSVLSAGCNAPCENSGTEKQMAGFPH